MFSSRSCDAWNSANNSESHKCGLVSVGQSFASRGGGQRFASQGCTHTYNATGFPRSCPASSLHSPPSTPGGGVGGGGTWWWWHWPSWLLEEGVPCARVRPLATGGEVCTPWWLAANWRFCQHRWASIGIYMADMWHLVLSFLSFIWSFRYCIELWNQIPYRIDLSYINLTTYIGLIQGVPYLP